jgi:hypothetical protein
MGYKKQSGQADQKQQTKKLQRIGFIFLHGYSDLKFGKWIYMLEGVIKVRKDHYSGDLILLRYNICLWHWKNTNSIDEPRHVKH